MLDIFEGVYQGIITVGDDIFILKGNIEDKLFLGYSEALKTEVSIEKELMKPLLKGENIKRYQNTVTNMYVFYPHYNDAKNKTRPFEEDVLRERFPYAYKYICNFKDYLVDKKIKYKTNPKYWYSLHRAREITMFEKSKIITPQLQNYPNFTLDLNACYPDAGGYSLVKRNERNEDIRYLLGILNSSVLWFFIKNISTPFNNNYYYFKSAYLGKFSFPKTEDIRLENSICELVSNLQDLYNSQEIIRSDRIINEIENEINKLIYRLYDFTQKEISFIERMNAKGGNLNG